MSLKGFFNPVMSWTRCFCHYMKWTPSTLHTCWDATCTLFGDILQASVPHEALRPSIGEAMDQQAERSRYFQIFPKYHLGTSGHHCALPKLAKTLGDTFELCLSVYCCASVSVSTLTVISSVSRSPAVRTGDLQEPIKRVTLCSIITVVFIACKSGCQT